MALTRIQTNALQSAITSGNIADGTIVAGDLASGAVTAPKLASGAVENYMSTAGTNFMFRNKVINGDMRIDQRNVGTSIANNTAGTQFSVDRWNIFGQQASKFNAQQSSTAPAGFTSSLLITSASAYTPLTGDRFIFRHKVEGNNMSDLAWGTSSAKAVVMSFWVRSSVTGTYGGVIHNDSQTRSFPYTYTVSQANTWEYKTVAISGCTDGTWEAGVNTGIQIWFSLGAGATYQSSTSNAWVSSGNPTCPTGCVDLVATSGATFYITGVQLEAGTVATPFERRPYGLELDLCRRYCQAFGNSAETQRIAWGGFNSATSLDAQVQLTPPMRVRPTSMTVINSGRVLDFGVNWDLVTVATLGNEGAPTLALVSLTTSGTTAAQGDIGIWGSTAANRVQVYFEAEI